MKVFCVIFSARVVNKFLCLEGNFVALAAVRGLIYHMLGIFI